MMMLMMMMMMTIVIVIVMITMTSTMMIAFFFHCVLTQSCHVSHSDHHNAKSPSDSLVRIFAKMQGTDLFSAKTKGKKVGKGVLSLEKKNAVVIGLLFPILSMACKQNGTSSTSAPRRSGLSANWISLVKKVNSLFFPVIPSVTQATVSFPTYSWFLSLRSRSRLRIPHLTVPRVPQALVEL
jgi:hypothetical protein